MEIQNIIKLLKSSDCKIYHKYLGYGTFQKINDKQSVITIKFEDADYDFEFPLRIKDGTLKINYEEDTTSEYAKELQRERAYLADVQIRVKKALDKSENDLWSIKLDFNDFEDGELKNIHVLSEYSSSAKNRNLLYEISRRPFFARVDYKEKDNRNKIYIGKNGFGEIVDWRASQASLYYHYKVYSNISNEKRVTLVRDFDIAAGTMAGFSDTFRENVEGNKDEKTAADGQFIGDERLLKIIKRNRQAKEINDIIETIQINQYNIITFDAFENILLMGCAGSGKTALILHRLSFIFYNNKVSLKDMIVVSPTSQLNLEIDELSKKLQLNGIFKNSIVGFNKWIIKSYFKNYGIVSNKSIERTTYLPNNFSDEVVKKLYASNYMDALKRLCDNIIYRISLDSKKFINFKVKEIYKYCFIDDSIKNQLFNKELKHPVFILYRQYEQILSKIGRSYLLREIDETNKNIIKSKREGSNPTGNIQKYKRLQYVYENNKELLGDDSKNSLHISALYNFFNYNKRKLKSDIKSETNLWMINFFKENDLLDKYDDIFHLIVDIASFINKRNLLINYINNGNWEPYFDSILEYVIIVLKAKLGINLNKNYQFETYLKCNLLSMFFSSHIEDRKLIYVDEVQDFSSNEINMYKKIFKNSLFNYFGDPLQCINPKGMTQTDLLKIVRTDNIFYLKENYRNAKEITEYVNTKFSLSMIPIGLDGKVGTSKSLAEVLQNIKVNSFDRVVVIVKNEEILNYLKIEYPQLIVVNEELDEIKKGEINLMTVMTAKGLEFEKVIVIDDGMSYNESYVAHTRALNELYIVSEKFMTAINRKREAKDSIINKIDLDKKSFSKKEKTEITNSIVEDQSIKADNDSKIEQISSDEKADLEYKSIIDKFVKVFGGSRD